MFSLQLTHEEGHGRSILPDLSQACFIFSELDSDLPEDYCNPEHLYDIWHLIKVKYFSVTV